MRISKSARFGGAVALGAISVTALIAAGETAWAKKSNVARVGRIETPLGLQGTRGAGGNVGIIFNLIDETRRKTDVEVQYGVDTNADGVITEDEFHPATEDRFDSRDTRRNKAPQLFTTAGDIGAAQQYIWKSLSDIQTNRYLTLEYALTPQGRQIPDPDNPGSFLFATGPTGSPLFAGVQVRVRAFRKQGKTKITGDWVVSDSFGVNNNNPPSATINSIDSNGVSTPTASDEIVMIHWTAYDADSEDLNGNGQLDIAAGEDINGNGVLDCEKVGAAFDYHRLAANENPGSMTPDQLAALTWLPCTRKKGVGDTDSLDGRPGVPIPTEGDLAGVCSAPPGVGRNWTFAWDSVTDVGTAYAKFIFRVRPFDQKRENGDYSYFSTPTQLDNRAIFKPDSATFPVAGLTSGRIGHTVTQVISSLNANDPQDRGEPLGLLGFQNVLVAGGATSVNGGGVSNLDLMTINTTNAETTTSDIVQFSLHAARSYHTATTLDDGRILIVGGFDSTGTSPLATTEVFDPKTRTVVAGPNLATARAKHAAVKLSSGDVAVFGGVVAGGAVTNTCELIQFRQYQDNGGTQILPSTWTVAALPTMAVAQHSASAVLLPDQTVLVTGGVNAAGTGVQTAQLLDPLHDNDPSTPTTKDPAFIAVASQLSVARAFGTATPLINGNVLFAGGWTGIVKSAPEPRGTIPAPSAATSSMEVFNWQTRTFEPVMLAMDVARAQHLAVLLGDGSVLLAGGTTDINATLPPVSADADIVKIGTRDPVKAQWAANFLQINGDMATGRRLARAAAIDNGRVMIYGGMDATSTLSTAETFTPLAGSNRAPKARTTLPSNEQSWLFGAPIYYRLSDVDSGDRARVVVQFIDRTPTGDGNWRQCSPQASTIGGDVAEPTADLATVLNDDLSLAIDPVAKNTLGDHAYIWALQRDVVRPAPGTKSQSYNVRVIPSGAVVGTPGESAPIDVLYNTKVLPEILPFENYAANRPDDGRTANNGVPTNNLPAGTLTPNQGGDIRIWVHLRDLDGGVGNNGDIASCLYEYAVDTNGDGQISDQTNPPEFWHTCTPSGAASGHPSSANPQTNLQTYYYGAFPDPSANDPGSDPAFGQRPANKGWTYLDWDSARDIGEPATSFTNVWIRVTPSDTSTGFVRTVHNTSSSTVLRIIPHPDSIFLMSWKPRYSNNKNAMPVNDPIDFTFNGQISPASVTSTGVQVFRGTGAATSQVRGQLSLVNNANNTATVSFYPDPQSLNLGSVVYLQTAASTVLFPSDVYSVRIPGYTVSPPGPYPAGDPHVDPATGPSLRPLSYLNPTEYRTFMLIQAVPINAGAQLNDPNYKFTTAGVGVYANDQFTPSAPATSLQPATTTLLKSGTTSSSTSTPPSTALSFSFNRALDPNTLQSPNITTTLTGNTVVPAGPKNTPSVVPGRWTVTNTPGPNGTSSAVLTFTPLFQLPPTSQFVFAWNSGLKAFNGNAVPAGSFTYNTETYARVTRSLTNLESFSNTNSATNQNDTTVTTAVWGTDGCAPFAISGGTNGLTGISSPSGGSALSVSSGTTTLTLPTNNYSTITVSKGATLALASQSGQMSILATGDIVINGTVDFRGASGANGAHGNTTYPYQYYSCLYAGTRLGGSGRNGGGSGGNSVTSSLTSTPYRFVGSDGTAGNGSSSSQGQGGQIPTETVMSVYARYFYGAGGGAGGGNATSGLAGGRACTAYSALNGYGATSTPGVSGGDAYFSTGINAGGGGGGGGSTVYPSYGQQEGGGGGAGAGGVTFNTNGNFTLSATGLISGRGGNGGASAQGGGSGGGGAGGSLFIISRGVARLNGIVDLRGGNGGAKGWASGTYDYSCVTNASSEKTARYGGDGANGRLVVLAQNYVAADEVRVFGQLYVQQIATLPTTATAVTTPPFGLDGSVTTTTYNFSGASVVHWTSLTVASGAIVDLRNDTTSGANNPVQIFVDGSVSIAGTLRLNGNSAGTAGPNYTSQSTYPNNNSYAYIYPAASAGAGMSGNMGGGKGGDGYDLNTSVAYGTQATNGTGPSPGVHNMKTTTGYYYYWYMLPGDSGGSGGANATEGEDGWACYAVPAAYNYLGAVSDTTGAGNTSQSGQTSSTAPKRLGTFATDPTAISISNLASFAGSGGGGGSAGYDSNFGEFGMAGIGGGGAGAIGIVSPTSVSVSGTVESRGGDGQTPGQASVWYYNYAHGGGGGGSGGTVYIASSAISIGAVTPSTGAGGATFDLRGGAGGGYRGTNTVAGLQAYPEYYSMGSFGGKGGYGMLVLAVTPTGTVNGVANNGTSTVTGSLGKPLANRWGMEQTTIDSATNTYKTLAGTARFYCPGMQAGGTYARTKWYDLSSINPTVDAFKLNTVVNATLTTKVEGAQSAPTSPGTLVPPNGAPDPANTSGLFVVPGTTGFLKGWRYMRFELSFVKTTTSTGGAVVIDDALISYTSDF
jgi:hypothetical protein